MNRHGLKSCRGVARGVSRNIRCAALLALVLATAPAHSAPGAHGPGGEHLDGAVAANASGLARLPDGSVNIPKLAQRRMGIRTLPAPETEAAATAELAGRVVTDPNSGGRVQPVLGGRIEAGPAGLPVAGQAVRRGQVLAWVRHHAEPYARANQQAQLTELRVNRALAEQRVKRLESLEGTVPRKDIEAARAELASLAERERGVGASLSSREVLTAPVTGVIARADAISGQVVEARDVLFEIVDPARMMIEAVTPDAALAARIESASLSGVSSGMAGGVPGGVPGVALRLAGAARSLRDGVLPLTFRVQGASGAAMVPLAVGQPVSVIVKLRERIKGVVLPAQAVVRNPANQPVVWIKAGAERYVPQPVEFQVLDAQTVVVTRGLAPDNRVVVQGALLIAQIR